MKGRLIVFARYPRPGRVKTRLVPPLSHHEAAVLYTAMLCDSLRGYRSLPQVEPSLFVADPDDCEPLGRLLREQGVIDAPGDLPIRAQRGNDLGERLSAAFADMFAEGPGPVAVVGTDHPSLPLAYLSDLFAALADHDLALGPAEDGGYYAMGLGRPQPELFREMPWSTPELFGRTLERAGTLAMRTAILPEWYDVDDERTLRRLMEEPMEEKDNGNRNGDGNETGKGHIGPMVAAVLAELRDRFADVAGTGGTDRHESGEEG